MNTENMIILYSNLVLKNRISIDAVPENIRSKVKEIVDSGDKE